VLLEDAAALAELGNAGVPGALLRDGDFERVLGRGVADRARQREDRQDGNGKSSGKGRASHDFLHGDDGFEIACYLDGMTLRPPQASSSSRTARLDALDYEIAQEQVSALGRMGRALEAALAALAEYDRSYGEKDAVRESLVRDASDALWCFMVQREAFGLRDPRPVIRDYRVPAEVHNRMGAFGRR
jgi:hypothetical protein